MLVRPITNFSCYDCDGFGHKAVDYKKSNFDSNNSHSKILRDTNPRGNERIISNEMTSN